MTLKGKITITQILSSQLTLVVIALPFVDVLLLPLRCTAIVNATMPTSHHSNATLMGKLVNFHFDVYTEIGHTCSTHLTVNINRLSHVLT